MNLRSSSNPAENPPDSISILLRYDDFSSSSPTDLERRIIGCLEVRGMSCALAVIPRAAADQLDSAGQGGKRLGPEKIELLRLALTTGSAEVLLHGCEHRALPRSEPFQVPSEFAGSDYECQLQRLKLGRDLLEEAVETPVTLFAPPWNSYDRNTLRALETLGFRCLSAGTRFGAVDPAASLSYLPATCSLQALPEALARARSRVGEGHGDGSATLVALFHPYDFIEVDAERGSLTLDEFASTLDWIKNQEGVHLSSFEEELRSGKDYGARRYLGHREVKHLERLVPPPLRGRYVDATGVYLEAPVIRRLARQNRRFLASAYLLWAAVFAGLTYGLTYTVLRGAAWELEWLTRIPSGPIPMALLAIATWGLLALKKKQTYKTLGLGFALSGLAVGLLVANLAGASST